MALQFDVAETAKIQGNNRKAVTSTRSAQCWGTCSLAEVVAEPAGGVDVWDDGGAAGAIEQQLGGGTGLGAETPAISEPRPSFCSVGASSLPFASIPFAD